jgi:type I restriction enzyme R subunit
MTASYESESVTRRKRIKPQLNATGWTVVPFDEDKPLADYARHAIVEHPTDNVPADYALVVGGCAIGVVEAKKLSIGPAGALTQAERYARGFPAGAFDFRGLRVPFLYSTNGEVIHFHDVRDPLDRFVVFGEAHLRYLLSVFLSHYHQARPHQSLGNAPPCGPPFPAEGPPPDAAAVVCEERLGGLIKHYSRKAA